ncbi:amidinotransferase [Actinoplanes sp. DH11]|uniref:amidinotransferase n=1 Tax=Actinoplanes sp. DH11 TaxID=2857011 RepID=UPI001E4CB70B|nr:amidinotransferase [Actinoplanes sp. DH11]
MSENNATTSPVSSYNEWDPLEEVIVGVMDGAAVPEWDVAVEATMPARSEKLFRASAGQAWPAEHAAAAVAELDGFARTLTELGVRVVRPDAVDHRRPFATPNWRSPGGLYSAMPRDLLLVVGDTIIEAPMAWRSRYFEIDAYRNLLTDYFRRGARWISAPKPQLTDDIYDAGYDTERPYESGRYLTTEFEPTFDAADFIRCGTDIFAQRSHVTNQLGIDWVARHIGGEYTVHVIDVTDPSPMHIDASFMPLAPGKLLLNPNRVKSVPAMFDSWDIRFAPDPALPRDHELYMSSAWVSMNVIMLDERRVVVEAGEQPLIDMFADWDMEPVPVPFRNVMRFGGCFHCVTADVRRRGTLRSYF